MVLPCLAKERATSPSRTGGSLRHRQRQPRQDRELPLRKLTPSLKVLWLGREFQRPRRRKPLSSPAVALGSAVDRRLRGSTGFLLLPRGISAVSVVVGALRKLLALHSSTVEPQ